MIYIFTKSGLQKFWQRAYDTGREDYNKGMQLAFEAGKRWAQNKGFIISGIPYSTGPEAFNPKMRNQIDEILK